MSSSRILRLGLDSLSKLFFYNGRCPQWIDNGLPIIFFSPLLLGIISIAHLFWLIVAKCFFYGSSTIIVCSLNQIIRLSDFIGSTIMVFLLFYKHCHLLNISFVCSNFFDRLAAQHVSSTSKPLKSIN